MGNQHETCLSRAREIVRNLGLEKLAAEKLGEAIDGPYVATCDDPNNPTYVSVHVDISVPAKEGDEKAQVWPEKGWCQHKTACFALRDEEIAAVSDISLARAVLRHFEAAISRMRPVRLYDVDVPELVSMGDR